MNTHDIELPSSDEAAAHMLPSDLKKFESGEHVAEAFSIAVGNPDETSQPLFTLDQVCAAIEADRKRRGEPEVSTTQVLITLGKVIAGYRPGEEGWSEYDQQTYDAAIPAPQPAEPVKVSDDLAHEIWAAAQTAPGEGIEDSVERVAALLARYGQP